MTTTTSYQIHDLGSRWVDAELAADADVLDTLATDDFRLVGPFGFVLDKQQWLDRYRSGDFVTTDLTWHDVDLREYGDSVVTIGTQSQHAAYKGSPSNGEFRITHVFVRDGDHLCPPGSHVMLLTQVRHDFLMRHFLTAGCIEVLEPARPGLARLCFDGFVTHSRFFGCGCHS